VSLDEASVRWRPYGTTALYDALARVAEVAKESHRSRRAVVLVSDGIDNASTVASDQARALLQGAGLPVFVLDVAARFERTGGPARVSDLAEPVEGSDATAFSLAELAAATGGRYLEAADHVAMQSAADRVFRDLRQQYLLGFTTDSAVPAGWHRIEVALRAEKDADKADKKDAPQRLRHRTRYFGSPPAVWSASAAVPAGDAATLAERRRLRGPDRLRAAPQTSSFE
jgi:VWFA-related protein